MHENSNSWDQLMSFCVLECCHLSRNRFKNVRPPRECPPFDESKSFLTIDDIGLSF